MEKAILLVILICIINLYRILKAIEKIDYFKYLFKRWIFFSFGRHIKICTKVN